MSTLSSTFKYRVLVKLDGCHHTPEYDWQYRPVDGDAVYCYPCARTRSSVGIIDQYRVQCMDCRYARGKGQAKLNAEIDASKHHRKNPDHEVKLFLGRQLVHTWQKQAEKLDHLFTDNPLPEYPF